jgi:hypothetical protein
MDLKDLIKDRCDALDIKRKSIKERSGWSVQFCPCGHVFELKHDNPLVDKAIARTQIDALTLHVSECPVCNPSKSVDGFVRRLQ